MTPISAAPDGTKLARGLLDAPLDAVLVFSADDTILEWNRRATEIFGWSREEALGRKWAALLFPGPQGEALCEDLRRDAAGRRGKNLEKRLETSALRRNGEEFPVELKVTAVGSGKSLFFVGCLRDISARKVTLRELQETERQFSTLVQSISNYAICMLDRDGRVTSWNSGAERIIGFRAEEILGQHFSRFYTEEDQEGDLPMLALREAESAGTFASTGWRLRKDGSRFPASTVIEPIRDGTGTLIGFAKVTRDLSAERIAQQTLEQTQEKLAQSQKMEAIGQLTGGVAHDFNNLLTIVIGNLGIAQRAAGEGDLVKLRRALGGATRGARRAATLTRHLLAFSRQQPLDPRPLDLNRLIANDVDFLQRSLGETIAIEAMGEGGLWQVEIDRGEFEAALLNLALNARDAMPEGGTLTIETANTVLDEAYARANLEVTPGQYVLVAVGDEGVGMTAEVLERAFEPFFSTKPPGEGTGLGLSQVYGFIKQSGGHIKIYSAPGEGTTVKIYLPRYFGANDEREEPEEDPAAAGAATAETILLVEDNEDVRAYLVEICRDLGYRVRSAAEPSAALRILEEADAHIDLLLSDVVLPGGNGRDLARRAQKMHPDLKVLFMTGYSRNAIAPRKRFDAGQAVIQKPMTREDLAERIRSILDAEPPPKKR